MTDLQHVQFHKSWHHNLHNSRHGLGDLQPCIHGDATDDADADDDDDDAAADDDDDDDDEANDDDDDG
eukprot:5754136-Amphidinium_carterae.1